MIIRLVVIGALGSSAEKGDEECCLFLPVNTMPPSALTALFSCVNALLFSVITKGCLNWSFIAGFSSPNGF